MEERRIGQGIVLQIGPKVVDRLARGMARIAAAHYAHPVIVRLSDFKSNEYAGLIGGRFFEPTEANPMIGWRGASRFDGFSIGSNDLTQLTLGVDRDSELLSDLFDECNEAVTESIASLIERAYSAGIRTGLCGQAPSDYPEFAEFLVSLGIDLISISPDSLLAGKRHVAAAGVRRVDPGIHAQHPAG